MRQYPHGILTCLVFIAIAAAPSPGHAVVEPTLALTLYEGAVGQDKCTHEGGVCLPCV